MKSWQKSLINSFKQMKQLDKDSIAKLECKKLEPETINKLHILITTSSKANLHWDLRDLHYHHMLRFEITFVLKIHRLIDEYNR